MPINLSERAIRFADSASIDPFFRARVSQPKTLFDSKLLHGKDTLFWAEKLVTGGTSVHTINRASVSLTVTSTNGSKVIRQTKQCWNYQPGKGQVWMGTTVFGAQVVGIRKRYGLFDASNGVFFEDDGTDLKVCIRSNITGSPVDSPISQSNWNLDKLDGNGPSGVTINLSKAQLFWIDYEWLSIGRVRFGVYHNGLPIVVHHIFHTNVIESSYMSTPNLPVRCEIENVSAASGSAIEQICTSVQSDGGQERTGFTEFVSRGSSTITGNDAVLPIISIRLKTTALCAAIFVKAISVIGAAAVDVEWSLIINPTVAGSDAAVWVDAANGEFQYDVTRDNSNTLSGGTRITGGYFTSEAPEADPALDIVLGLGADIDGARDEWVLTARPFGNKAVSGGLVIEQLS